MKTVYLDSAATTQLRPEVVETMTAVLADSFGNPSSTHHSGRASKSLIEKARKDIAKQLNVHPGEIIFTSGGTEADNLILQSCVRDLGVERIISSPIEHHAVLHTIEELAADRGIQADWVNIKKCSNIDYEHLAELLSDTSKKTLVSLMHINNEVGTKLDVERVAAMAKDAGAYFHSDTVQSIGHYDVDLGASGIDFAAVAAHKFHGPKGAGFAYVRKDTGLKPLIFGGAQERGMRAGTESTHNIVGMAKALEMAYANLEEERAHIQGIKDYFIAQLNEHMPGINFNGSCADPSQSTYTLLNVCLPIPPQKALMLLFQMDLKGIACSKGSACQSGSTGASHVLSAFLSEEDLKKPSLRFSFSIFNTKEEIDYVVGILKEFIDS
ncbi:cysteine desulfurase family protein [Gilvibacter sp.]|uniref:cysteine desulfurase family protein n=1 Tax=Gilvibacter sp. TaxID=2729997 RepID=UPI003F49F485